MKRFRFWKNPSIFLPILHLYIEIPFISIRTIIMGQSINRMTREYIMLQVKIWKWSFDFELYDTYKRIRERDTL